MKHVTWRHLIGRDTPMFLLVGTPQLDTWRNIIGRRVTKSPRAHDIWQYLIGRKYAVYIIYRPMEI